MEQTRLKLAEAAFFLREFESVYSRILRNEPMAPRFYLSAFLGAGRAVGYCAQAEHGDVYRDWFATYKDTKLTPDERDLLRFTKDQRDKGVHYFGAELFYENETVPLYELAREGSHVEFTSGGPLGVPMPTTVRTTVRFSDFPNESPVDVCRRYLHLMNKIADALETFLHEQADA
jgi:hypothetical protein